MIKSVLTPRSHNILAKLINIFLVNFFFTSIEIVKIIMEKLAGTRSNAKLRAIIDEMINPSTSYVNNVPNRKLNSTIAMNKIVLRFESLSITLSESFKFTS